MKMTRIRIGAALLFLLVIVNVRAQSAYKMAGPYEVVARDGEYRNTKAGSERDMQAALNLAREGREEDALLIVNAYATTLQRLDGHDAPLCAIQCFDLVRAMTLLKSKETKDWSAMIHRALVPMMDRFEADSPYANGNWGAIVNRLRMACAIFLQDSMMYKSSVNYYLHAYDNGSLPRYIGETGQCQETGRDQGHVQLGLEALAQTCEMAWEQGTDLWGALDNRLMKGFEYTAKYNLGYDVPYIIWQDCTGLYCDWTEPGQMGRGKLWDIYQLPYNHYVNRKGMRMPYTERILKGAKPKVKEYEKLHQVFTFPAPNGAPLKEDYHVYIQPRGSKEWTKIDTYMAKVNAPIGNNRHKVSEISYAFFDFTGDVFVRVVKKNVPVSLKGKKPNVRIRPDYKGVIANVQNDSTVQFLLFQPENVSVEFDGDITNNLLLFTSKPCLTVDGAKKEARKQGRDFVYYAPGMYRQDTIHVPSNTTIYLAGGSYFTGTFAIEDVHDVSILGRGIARPSSGFEGCHVHRSNNVLIDGLILNTCPVGGSDHVTLSDVRSISHPGWGDGLNVFASSVVLYDRVFCRNSDDCTTAYATRKGFSGSTRHVRMRNSTLWADVAHPIFIGIHGNAERGDTIENLVYENIDILCQSEPQVDYQGCLAINCGDNNTVRNVLFDNIRIENLHQGSLLQVKVGYNRKYCTAPGRKVEDITFRNIRYNGEQPYLSVINGYDENHIVRNVSFEGLKVNGRTIYDDMPDKPKWYSTADYVPMFVGNHVENVVFTRSFNTFNANQPLAYCATQVDRALEAMRPYQFTMMPRNILQGQKQWNLRKASAEEWCSGFWSGITFTAVPAYCWIGRAPFSGDSYLKQTLVADFRLYNVAVADQTIAELSSKIQNLEYEYANGGGGNNASLLKAIDEAEQLLDNANAHPEGAIVMLRDALTVSRNIANSDKSQMLYDSYETELRSAIGAYKNAKGVVFDVSGITDVYDIERGFRHPGGLHTQADFERIKRQLADNNPLVTAAWEKLKSAGYSQSSTQTYPVETIVRGGGTGENYLNAARGATMAYQNALRWKIEGTKANASAAVRILMAWARGCKLVSGDSNWALAAGLYGYEFAQAAELMRDYEGWSRDDFNEFKQWMLKVWYPGNINFLRGRNGTWENYVGGQGGIRPGHYWSNWPLCNALAVISIGILCDDVFIYNQGMSFMKYDQVGTFQEPRTADPILNDGCTEFIGNLVVTTKESALETGAYGRLGQMQESGRDGGHAAMALGLAVDICKVAWNQGDDLFSYMDNRMAAGIEYVAACTQNVQGLPWTNYKYVDCRTAWHNGWLMTAPAEPAEVRNYWATVIGHYESVKGVSMPFAERAYEQMGIDAGGTGGTSGPYDHLGYSVLMNTYDTQLCPEEKRPTLLTPRMEYDGKTVDHNELGGLRNTYIVQSTQPVPVGKTVKLMPQLPDGEEDTGLWKWSTGETTKDITVNTDRSYVYRVTYTNKNGIESEQAFSIAVEGDCTPSMLNYAIYVNDVYVGDTIATVFYGDKITLNAGDSWGWNPVIEWDNGTKGAQTSYGFMATERTIRANVVNQGGRKQPINFHIRLKYFQPNIIVNGTVQENKTHVIANDGDVIVLQPYVPTAFGEVSYQWNDGSTTSAISLSNIDESVIYTVTITASGHEETLTYEVFVKGMDTSRIIPQGNYLVHHVATDTYLTDNGLQQPVTFTKCNVENPTANQIWYISSSNKRHSLQSLSDSLSLNVNGITISNVAKSFYFEGALGVDRYALHSSLGTAAKYLTVTDEGSVDIVASSTIPDFPFELIPVGSPDAIRQIQNVPDSPNDNHVYDLQGRRQSVMSQKRIYIVNGKKYGSVFHW